MLALRDTGLLYTASEERFDRITRIAARLFETPIALLTFVTEHEQWFKSSQGLEATAIAREFSFCGHAIVAGHTFVVEDARADERFAINPLVTGEPKMRFYAGEPVRRRGECIGMLCVIDTEPRSFSEADRQILKDLAALAERELDRGHLNPARSTITASHSEAERKASIDPLTRLWDREAILELLGAEVAQARREAALSVALLDVDNFKLLNDTYGRGAGDRVLVEVAARLRGAIRDSDCLGRFGGQEFLALLPGCGPGDAAAAVSRLLTSISGDPIALRGSALVVTASAGYACLEPGKGEPGDLVAAAESALDRAKRAGRNRAEFARAS